MKNEARSHSHRWVVEPSRLVIVAGEPQRTGGHVIRQRLHVPIKRGWRLATWDEIDAGDPQTVEAFDYKREIEARGVPEVVERVRVYRDGAPDAGPPVVPTEPPAAAPVAPVAPVARVVEHAVHDQFDNVDLEIEE